LQSRLLVGGQPVDARGQHLLDRLRHADTLLIGGLIPGRPRQFLEEERVTFPAPGDRRRSRVSGVEYRGHDLFAGHR
jgi:hypothetical protein